MITRIQAESLQRVGFRVESSGAASGGSMIGFAGGSANETGTASTGAAGLAGFGLTSGTYDIYLGYFDENDGVGRIEVSLGGSLISGINLNASLPSTAADRRTLVRRQIASGLTVDASQTLSILGRENAGESTRIDYIEFIPVSNPTPTPGTLAFSSVNYSVNENSTPVTTVTVTRTGGSSGAVSATVTPTNGTATAGSDFTSTPIVVNFAEGQTSQTVTIPITNDTDVEGNETVNLTLSNLTGGATVGTQTTATLTIIDNDTPPLSGVISFGAASFTVNENGTTPNTVTVARTGDINVGATVTINLRNGTAIATNDYTDTPITVTFADGESALTAVIPVVNDDLVEGSETINLSLSDPTNGFVLGTQTTTTVAIADDDVMPPPTGTPIRIEAESMTRSGYRIENNSIASNRALLSLVGSGTTESGSAFTSFSGIAQRYNVYVNYFDESDGQAQMRLQIGTGFNAAWTLNQNLNSSGISNQNRVNRFVGTLDVTPGTRIDIFGTEQSQEHARVDYIEFVPVGNAPPPDAIAPTASLTASNITTSGGSDYTFTVTYSDAVAINVATLDNNDISVISPNGTSQQATFISYTPTGTGSPRTSTYRINAPDGSWDQTDNGTYTVAMQARQVTDTAGNAVAAGSLGSFSVLAPPGNTNPKDLGAIGSFHEWHKVEIVLRGRNTNVTASDNPFLTNVNVTFTGPGGTFTVPAFYDGDGNGGTSGNVWKVRFSANALGGWTFTASSSDTALNGYSGSFVVTEAPASAPNFLRWGRLQYAGGHYLKFADGDYWIKTGTDDPENFLGTAFGSMQERLEAIDYLSSRGVNSIYFVSNNVDSDSRDTWPWLGSTSTEAKANSNRFNINKLQEWETVFSYAQQRGVALHWVLTDDSAWRSFDHDVYYREMVARFGYHPAIIWNLGEEANEIYTDQQQIDFAAKLRAIDPYDHPVTVHRQNVPWPFLGNPNFDLTSMQTLPGGNFNLATTGLPNLNNLIETNRRRSIERGRPIPIMLDEIPRIFDNSESTRVKFRSEVLYPIYLAGGQHELFFNYSPNLRFQAIESMWDDMRRTRQLLETLPFNNMAPNNALLSTTTSNYAFAQTGAAYAIYLRNGGIVNLDLRSVTGTFQVLWYDVTTGTFQNGAFVEGGDWRSLGNPVFSGDVAARITRSDNAQTLVGTRFSDILTGDDSATVLIGGEGNDVLTGKGGSDTFRYNLPREGVDILTDFTPDDRLEISAAGFGGSLVAGTSLNGVDATGVLRIDANPESTLATFLFNTSTGVLQFDADGLGAGLPIAIATLQGTAQLIPDQITLVA
ncbi:MAG: Calx-beta domain-containing protein [Oculatellaceae cyanobacterium bins.114]|nr:Calx-beta domain-containing protein [Oculatellaceae cyanobacterium bins.114]